MFHGFWGPRTYGKYVLLISEYTLYSMNYIELYVYNTPYNYISYTTKTVLQLTLYIYIASTSKYTL